MTRPLTDFAAIRRGDLASFMEFDLAASRQKFIGMQALPVIEVGVQAGSFGKIQLAQLLRAEQTERAPGTAYNRISGGVTKADFSTTEHGIEETIDQRERNMYRDFIDAEKVALERARDVVLREQEKRTADLVFNTTTWTGAALTTAAGTAWTTAATADPRANVKAAKQKVRDGTGLEPNVLILTVKAFEALQDVDAIIDRVKYSGHQDPTPGKITEQAIADALGIERLLVAGAHKNTAAEGSATLASIWTDTMAMVARVAMSSDPKEPCIGRTYHWGEDGSQIGGSVESYYEEAARSDVVRVRHDTDERILYPALGHLLTGVTA